MLCSLDPGLGIPQHYSRNSRYDTVTTVRKYNLISEVHKETRTSFDRLRSSASKRASERASECARTRARIVDGPNQLVTSLGCASHFDRNLLASIINLRVPPSSSVNLLAVSSPRRVSSRLASLRLASSLLVSPPSRLESPCAYEEKRRVYKRSDQAWNSICLKNLRATQNESRE